MSDRENEYQVIKGGAIKYAMDHLIKPKFEKEFHKPAKDWVLQSDDETRVVGGKKLYIQRTKAKAYTDIDKVSPDFMVLVKANSLTREDLVGLIESGALGITDVDAIAKLCTNRLNQQESKYKSMSPTGDPALRWPGKTGIQGWFYAMKSIADLSLQITRVAKSKAVKTMDKLLAQK